MIKNFLITLILSFLISTSSFGFIHTINNLGKNVRWKNSSGNLNFFFNSNGCDAMLNTCTASTLNTIASNSAAEWSNNSNFNITVSLASSNPSSEVNNIYFSGNSSLFGSGVVAITQISYKENDSYILEADIIINSAFDFMTSSNKSKYLGNILSHEMGHMLGMAHGQVFRSTMFYSLTQGQYTLSDDDKSGVKNLYGLDTAAGSISGQIIGGNARVPIFGAHVQAISSTSGLIKTAVLSKSDGSFKLPNLPLDEIYYIYVGPTKLTTTTLPDFYRNIKSNFCNSSQSFRGSFFQTCNNSEKGEPQKIYLSSSRKNVDVGLVTIRCNLDVPVDYSISKDVSPYTINALDLNQKVSYAQTGYFTKSEASVNTEDEFNLDLSAYVVGRTDLYLEVRVISQSLYSQIVTQLKIKDGVNITTTFPEVRELDLTGVPYDLDLAPRLDVVGRVNLSQTMANNNFTLKVRPTKLSDYLLFVNNPTTYWTEEDFFPISSKFSDGLLFYLLVVNIVKSNGDGTFSRYSMPSPTNISDNSSCPDASRSYTNSGYYSSSGESGVIKSSTTNPIACGSIDSGQDGPGGNGPVSFAIGILLSYFLFRIYSNVMSVIPIANINRKS